MIKSLVHDHPDVTIIKTVWVCTCEFKTEDTDEALDHAEEYPDHTITKCVEF